MHLPVIGIDLNVQLITAFVGDGDVLTVIYDPQ